MKPVKLTMLILGAAFALTPASSFASDHSDGVKTALDLAGDIVDLFTFTSPKDPNKVVMIMNVNGFAGQSSRFSDAVDYKFRIRPITDTKTLVPSDDPAKEQSVVCSFTGGFPFVNAKQRATCVVNVNGGPQTISFDTRDGAGFKAGGASKEENGVRVFAGVRSDAWFADLSKIVAFDKGTRIDKSNPKNGLQGKNVLSIVVEMDKSKLSTPLLAITAQTIRRSGL